jgi:hypothetical protein
MSAKLVAYEYVPLGFEMVIENTEGKIWNLWFNVQLSDDPEKWDNEVRSINNLQRKLGDLNVNHRLIRAQMAEFCRVHPLFPESIAILYKEIGEEKLSKPVKVGCEGRDLLDSLGHHDSESLNKQQKEILKSYCESLKKWLDKDDRESSTDSKVFGFLGTFTKLKKEWVENLISLIDKDKLVLSSIQSLAEEAFKKKDKGLLRKARQNYLGRPFNCFKCEECARCGCCSTMFIDSTLLCIGTLDEKGSIFTEFRRFIQENVLAYSLAINSWLEEHAPENIIQSTTPSYITKEQALEIANDVHSSLGDKDEVEIWLTACLLKTIKSNQRWHRPTELIDSFPKATSWLKTLDPSV